jgi:hypothetical protein
VYVPSDVIEGSAESLRAGDVGELATFGRVTPRKEKKKKGRMVDLDDLTLYQEPLSTSGLNERAAGATAAKSLEQPSHREGR